jgi:hypothetical protein
MHEKKDTHTQLIAANADHRIHSSLARARPSSPVKAMRLRLMPAF